MASHLTLEERDRLAQFLHQGLEQKEIASILGRSTSTICRELQRNPTGKEYLAGQAQQHAERRRSERPLSRRMDDPEINESVRSGLAQQWRQTLPCHHACLSTDVLEQISSVSSRNKVRLP